MNDDTRLDCSDYDYEKRPQARGILTDTAQARARQMLRDISDKQKATDKKEPFIMTMERRDLRNFWIMTRNFTDMEFDMIKQVHGRIKKGYRK